MAIQETSNEQTQVEDYSPLSQPVIKREYTNHAVDANIQMPPLETPTFQTPNYEDVEELEKSTSSKQEEPEEERPFNESYSELPNKEKAMGAKMMAEMVIDMYSKGCGYLGKIPELSESKIDRLIAEGEIEPNLSLETASGDMPIKEFAVEYNNSLKGAFEVSDEFKENVKPPLERVFKKRGLAMTDEQLLIYYFATDFGAKGVQAFMIRKTTTGILDTLKEQTQLLKDNKYRNPVQPTQPQYQPAPKPEDSITPPPPIVNTNDDFTENIAEVITPQRQKREPIPRRRPERSVPKTNLETQINNFAEPEEVENGVFANLSPRGGFTNTFQEPDSNPTFGDVEILSGLNKVAQEFPTRPESRKKSTTRKPKK